MNRRFVGPYATNFRAVLYYPSKLHRDRHTLYQNRKHVPYVTEALQILLGIFLEFNIHTEILVAVNNICALQLNCKLYCLFRHTYKHDFRCSAGCLCQCSRSDVISVGCIVPLCVGQ